MDPFAILPPPILLAVAKNVDDLASLHALRSASPAVAFVLQEPGLGAEVAEAVISFSLPLDIQNIIRTLALVTWAEPSFMDAYVSSWNGLQELLGVETLPRPGHDRLPNEMPGWVILRVLALAKLVQCTTHRVVHALIRRCLRLQPKQPIDTNWTYRKHRFYDMGSFKNYQSFQSPPVPLCQEVQVETNAAAAPPSWIEEQRAISGVWRIYLHSTLAKTATNALGNELRALTPSALWQQMLRPYLAQIECVRTMAECITQLRCSSDTFLPLLPATTLGSEQRNCCMKTSQSQSVEWKQDATQCHLESPGAFFFKTLTVYHYSPLRYADFSLFRKYGFGIWDMKRMVALGFLYDDRICKERFGGKGRLAEQSNFFTWWSILTEDEAKSLEAIQRIRTIGN